MIWPSSIDLSLHENADAYRVCLLSDGLDLGSKVWSQQLGVGEVVGGRLMARNTQLYCRFHPPGDRPQHTGGAKRYLCWACEEALIAKAGTTAAPAFLHFCKPDVLHTLNGSECACRQPD